MPFPVPLNSLDAGNGRKQIDMESDDIPLFGGSLGMNWDGPEATVTSIYLPRYVNLVEWELNGVDLETKLSPYPSAGSSQLPALIPGKGLKKRGSST